MVFWAGLGLGILLGMALDLWGSRRWRRRWQRLLGMIQSRFAEPPADPIQGLGEILRRASQIQESHQQASQEWQQIIGDLPWGWIRVDEHNRVWECNPVAQQLLQMPSWQPGIKVMLEWVRSYELDQLIEQCRQTHQKISAREWIFYPPGADPKPHPLRAWGIPLPQGQVVVLLESRLEAYTLSQQRDRWSSDVAHELKTPLTSIRLVTETLQSRVDPQLRPWVDRLLEEVIRLSHLVQDLLELSRLNLGAATALHMQRLDLVAVIRSVCHSLEPLAQEQGRRFQIQGIPQLWLWGDEQRLYRLVQNLLSNSLRYGDPQTPIYIRVEQQGEQGQVDIYDHGRGFPEGAIPQLFEPFFRVDRARDRSAGGTGLGLAIVKQIVEAHGGSISAQNHPETGGAWLRFYLPLHLPHPIG
ncbi:MAG: HAMP domain-containing sensor histidine kinase [Thermostichales cyanobacterium HHBFW_bins_127]